jgi:hypothetical protein
MHERGKCSLICIERILRMRRQRIDFSAFRVGYVRDIRFVQLDEFRRVMAAAILPGAEPQQHQVQMMLTRPGKQCMQQRRIKMAALRLELLPVDRHFDGVQMQVLGCRPDLGQLRWPRTRIVHLRAQHQIRRTIDKQREATVLLHNMRQLRVRR